MPETTQLANNAAHIAANTEILGHLTDAAKILGPFVAAIITLVVWAWSKMEKTQDKLENAFIKHVAENDRLHDQIFTNMRETDGKLNELLGEHHATHGKG